jgi:hypothetical protein
VSICKTCGKKYSKWTTPVSASGVCRECFDAELTGEGKLASVEAVSPPPVAEAVPAEPKRGGVAIRLNSFLPRGRSKVVFALAMGCYSYALGSFISTWAYAAGLPRPRGRFYLQGNAPDVLGLLVISPLIESLMLVAVFELLRRVRSPDWVQVAASAAFISELHVWPWWPHAVIVLPPFLIQSASYLYWRRRSWNEAFWVLVSIHALHNVIPALSAIGRAIRHA